MRQRWNEQQWMQSKHSEKSNCSFLEHFSNDFQSILKLNTVDTICCKKRKKWGSDGIAFHLKLVDRLERQFVDVLNKRFEFSIFIKIVRTKSSSWLHSEYIWNFYRIFALNKKFNEPLDVRHTTAQYELSNIFFGAPTEFSFPFENQYMLNLTCSFIWKIALHHLDSWVASVCCFQINFSQMRSNQSLWCPDFFELAPSNKIAQWIGANLLFRPRPCVKQNTALLYNKRCKRMSLVICFSIIHFISRANKNSSYVQWSNENT